MTHLRRVNCVIETHVEHHRLITEAVEEADQLEGLGPVEPIDGRKVLRLGPAQRDHRVRQQRADAVHEQNCVHGTFAVMAGGGGSGGGIALEGILRGK